MVLSMDKTVLFVIFCFNICICNASGQVTVNTKLGRIIGSTQDTNFNGKIYQIEKFLGVPYAEPPIGGLRFAKPVPKSVFLSVFNASKFGPACPQDPEQMKLWIPGDPFISEDCLSLNIFRPSPSGRNNAHLPVMIWLHGGAYVIGQSSIYAAENLVAYTNVIVVTLNYRLGPLGFLATDDNTVSGNQGLWDQQLAIRWVHDNIASFGGDVQRVTLFGESAGGASAIYQAFYPPNQNLFQRLITESGVSLAPWAYGDKKKLGTYTKKFGNILGCKGTNNLAIVECLRKIPYAELISKSRVGTAEEELFRPEWVPVVDNEIVRQLPPDSFQNVSIIPADVKAAFGSKDILIGTDSGDGSMVSLVSVIPYILSKAKQPQYSSTMDVVDRFFLKAVMIDKYGVTSGIATDTISFMYTDWKDINPTVSNNTVFRKIHDIVADTSFIVPTRVTARVHKQIQRGNSKTYLFRFSHRSSYSPAIPWIPGCSHGDEIPYVFGFPNSMRKPYRYPELSKMPLTEMNLSLAVMQFWTNFARTGNPNSDGLPKWPEFNNVFEPFMELEAPSPAMNIKMYPERIALWTNLVPKLLSQLKITDSKQTSYFENANQLHVGSILG